jgi:hypothetical protein
VDVDVLWVHVLVRVRSPYEDGVSSCCHALLAVAMSPAGAEALVRPGHGDTGCGVDVLIAVWKQLGTGASEACRRSVMRVVAAMASVSAVGD